MHTYTHSPIHPFIHLNIIPNIHSSIHHPPTYLINDPSIYPPILITTDPSSISHSFIHPPTFLPIYLSTTYMSIYANIHPYIYPSIHPLFPVNHPSIYLPDDPLIHILIQPSAEPPSYQTTHLTHSSTYLIINPYIHISNHPFVQLSAQSLPSNHLVIHISTKSPTHPFIHAISYTHNNSSTYIHQTCIHPRTSIRIIPAYISTHTRIHPSNHHTHMYPFTHPHTNKLIPSFLHLHTKPHPSVSIYIHRSSFIYLSKKKEKATKSNQKTIKSNFHFFVNNFGQRPQFVFISIHCINNNKSTINISLISMINS